MLANNKAQMDVIIDIGRCMPKSAFLDWLESGLQQSMLFAAPDEAAENRRIAAAVARHGSLIAAMRVNAA